MSGYHDAMEWLGRVDRRLVEDLLDILEQRRAQTWRARAACRGEPTELFFPPRGSTPAEREKARTLCRQCPVAEQCLAASKGVRAGIWAGVGERERRRHRGAPDAA